MENALLHALVERGDGLLELFVDLGGVTLGEGLAQQAEAAADAALVSAVHRRLSLGLAGALQRRNMVGHDESLTFLLGIGMQAEETQKPHPPQNISIWDFGGWVKDRT